MTVIRINKAVFYSYHGVLEYEKKFGNKFEVDIEMKCDTDSLGDTDDLEKTVNYQEVYNLTGKIFSEKKFNLIETVNINICKAILDNFPQVLSVKVSISKPNAPLGIIDSVEVINKLKRIS
ncbi:MAG: dihydroneopterin aldolase [Bacteroidetes bacterium]|nr:dihydroneopterin aldolase [Bacteroidota bacterium]